MFRKRFTITPGLAWTLLFLSLFVSCVPLAWAEEAPPLAPWGLTALPSTPGAVHLAWNAPAYDGGAPVLEYHVYRTLLPGVPAPIGVASGTSFVDAVASDVASLYAYYVTAVNAAGESAPSNPISVSSMDGDPGPSCLDIVPDIPPGVGVNPDCLPRELGIN